MYLPKHANKYSKSKLLWVLYPVLTVALFVSTFLFIIYDSINDTLSDSILDTTSIKVNELSGDAFIENPPRDLFSDHSLNVLVMGIDSRVDQDESIINPEDDDETVRSDTTLLINITADRKIVNVVSIPRDLWIDLPDCRRSNGEIVYGEKGQFNWAFSYAAGKDDLVAGIACTEKTVESITGIPIDGFVVADFTGFSKIIESLGGVDVCIEEEISEKEYLNLEIPAGCQRLDPITATQYARVRYIGDGSDMGRIQRQQLLLQAMIKQVLNSNLSDFSTLYAFTENALSSLTLSPIFSNIKADVGLALSLKDAEIRFLTTPVVTADFDENRLLFKEPNNSELWTAIKNDDDLPDGIVYSVSGVFYKVIDGVSVEIEAPEPYEFME